MTLHLIDWTILIVFLLLSFFIGLKFKTKGGKSITDFFLGGRNLPWWIAGTSMVATTFAADTPLAVTELVATKGIAGNWLWWNMLAGGMLTTFFFAKYWRRANILTDVELIELRYSGKASKFLRFFRAIYLGVFMNCIIIGWVNIALVTILKVFFNVSEEYALITVFLIMLFVAIYSSLSGLLGVAYTDVVQFVIAMGGCIVLAILVLHSKEIGGINGLKQKLPAQALHFFPSISSLSHTQTLTLSISSFLAFVGMQWWASWYPGNEPGGGGYVAQRIMSTKNEKHAILSTLFFQIAHYALRPWPWIIVGLCSLVLYPDLGVADKKLGYVLVMKDYLPVGLKGLLLVAFFAAYMSTISTQLNWGASYLVNDVYKQVTAKSITEKKLVTASRLATMGIMLLSLIATAQITSISKTWEFIMECGAGLGLVLILRWYWWRVNAWSEIAATIIPFIIFGFSKLILHWEFPYSFFLTIACTTVGWISITLLTPATSNEKLQQFYLRIKPEGYWKPVQDQLGISPSKTKIVFLLICWLASIGLIYSFLFLIGHIIFKQWVELGLNFGCVLLFYIILNFFSKKIKLFE